MNYEYNMRLTELRIENFKSFAKAKVKLGKLNVIVGANSSGKTNFIQIFRFLKEYLKNGAENAISLLGGIENVLNSKLAESQNILINFKTNEKLIVNIKVSDKEILNKINDNNELKINLDDNGYYLLRLKNLRYEFDLRFPGINKFQIYENLIGNFDKKNDLVLGKEFKFKRESFLSNLNFGIRNFDSMLKLDPFQKTELREQVDFYTSDLINNNISNKLEKGFNEQEKESIYTEFSNKNFVFGIFDFNTTKMKESFSKIGNYFLDPDGANISIVLNKILSNNEDREKFLNLLHYVLPFINELDVSDTGNNFDTFLSESYDSSFKVSSQFFSDGVINIIAIIIALYFEKNRSLIIIEEPDRNIHPKLMGKIAELIKDASQTKQIIITTHNPELIKNFDFQDLILMKRNKKGFSEMIKPGEKKHLREFLDNEIGVDELFINNFYEE